MDIMEQNNKDSSFSNATKRRGIFNDVDTIAGIPTGFVLLSVVLLIFVYFITRSFLLAAIIPAAYLVAMYYIHKDDVHGFSVWLSCMGSNKLMWEAGRTTEVHLEIIHRKK
jgi:type IV secretory pathway VirB3-like protein